MPLRLTLSTSASTRLMVAMLSAPRRISTMPWTMSSMSLKPAMPSLGRLPMVTSGDIAYDHRGALGVDDQGMTDVLGRMDQAHSPHHRRLRAEIDRLARRR